jgi:hypothetical protein
MPDFAGPALVRLNDTDLTDQGRTFDEKRDERAVENVTANGTIKKYIIAEKREWDLAWSMLPQNASDTYDEKGARDTIKALAMVGNTVTLRVRDSYGEENIYTVWIQDYSEKIVRRDFVSNIFLYDVSISLKEQ